MSRTHRAASTPATEPARRRGGAGAGPRPAGRARGAVLRHGGGGAADGGGRGHPYRVRGDRADRDPGRVHRRGGHPGRLHGRVHGDDQAHHQLGSLLRVHLPGPGPGHRGGRRAGRPVVLHLPAGRAVRRAGTGRRRRGRRSPACAGARGGRGRWAPGRSSRSWASCVSTSPARSWASCSSPRSPSSAAETIAGLARPAGGHLSFATLVPGQPHLSRVGQLRGPGRHRRARVRRVRAAPCPGRRGPQRPADHPGGHVRLAGRDRHRVRRGELGHGRARRHQPRGGRRHG